MRNDDRKKKNEAWIPEILIEQACVCKIAETKVPRLFSHSHRPSLQTLGVNDLQPPACLITVWLAQDDLPPLSAPSFSPQSAADFQTAKGAKCFPWIQQRPAERRADIFIRWWGEYGFFFLSHLPLVFYYNIRPLIELNQACNPGIADSSSLQIALRLLCHYSAAGRMFSRYNHAIEKLENGQIRQGRFFFQSTSRGFSDIPVWAEKLPQVYYFYSRWKKKVLMFSNAKVVNKKKPDALNKAESSFNCGSLPKKLCQLPGLKCLHHNDDGEDVFCICIMSADKILRSVNAAERTQVIQREKDRQTERRCRTQECKIPLHSPVKPQERGRTWRCNGSSQKRVGLHLGDMNEV